MRYCNHIDHWNPNDPGSPWIQDGEPDHAHEKPRMRLNEGTWEPIDDFIRAGFKEAFKL